jgi:hypothetical protein
MFRVKTVAAVSAVGACVLVGCGHGAASGGSSTAYCDAVKGLVVRRIASSDSAPKMREIAEVAPEEIKADWRRFADIQEQLLSAASTGSTPEWSSQDEELYRRVVAFNEKTCTN